MKRFIFFYLFLIIQLSVYGQRRRVVTRPLSPVVHSTEQAASDQVLYMPLQALKMAIPLETHEHNHDHGNHTTVSVTSMRTRTARNLPKPSALWNHPSYVNSVNRLVGEGSGNQPMRMRSSNICGAPVVEASLESVYASIKPRIPMYLPYRHDDVTLWQGFYYNSGKHHGSIDYGRSQVNTGSDPTFGIYSIADGKVVDVGYTHGGGNYVTIEHTSPDGHKFRSSYLHLRNGFTHDLNKAKQTTDQGKYRKYVFQSNPSVNSWGTNSQKIKVAKGQYVKAGQFLAWAGNTGAGGIKMVLDNDGNIMPSFTKHKNVHLHFTLFYWSTSKNKWINIDPYGVYNKASNISCYDLIKASPYARLWAPFFPSFHNLPLNLINTYWGYYTGMGNKLQTISIDRNSQGKLLASGSFQRNIPGGWYARFYMDANQYQQYFNTYASKGFRPRQMQVSNDSQGKPRFSVVWEKNKSGEQYYAFHNQTDAGFNAVWNSYVTSKKYHMQEHVTYKVNGKRYHAGVFVRKSNNGFYMYYGLNSSVFNNKFTSLYAKWQLHSIHVNGPSVGGVWLPKKGQYAAYYGLTAEGYQAKFNQLSTQGMRLHKIQSYNNSTRFAAIWVK